MYVKFKSCVKGLEFRQEGLNFYDASRIYMKH